jgi:hypothetical protein
MAFGSFTVNQSPKVLENNLSSDENSSEKGAALIGRAIIIFNTVAELESSSLEVGKKVRTLDRLTLNGGGGANYIIVAQGTGTPNAGTLINISNLNQAKLLPDNDVNIKTFAASGLETDSAQNAYDAMKTGLPQAANINFEEGIFKGSFLSYDNALLGKGSNTRLLAGTADGFALKLGAHLPYWDYKAVRNLTVDGNGKIANCVAMDDSNVFAGRWFFDNVVLTDGNCGYITNAGSIGNSFSHSLFSDLNFGVFAKLIVV